MPRIYSDIKQRIIYQNWPSKLHQLPFDQGVHPCFTLRSPSSVPEPIGTSSGSILHRTGWPGFFVYYVNFKLMTMASHPDIWCFPSSFFRQIFSNKYFGQVFHDNFFPKRFSHQVFADEFFLPSSSKPVFPNQFFLMIFFPYKFCFSNEYFPTRFPQVFFLTSI